MGWPVVIAANGRGIPVTESPNGTPYEIATNGYGTPVVFVDKGGLPVSSVLPVWAAGASQAWDFTAGRYYNSAAVPTDTHGQTINADDAAGAYSAFAPNTLVRTSRGLQTTPSYTQFATNPQAPANQTISLATTGTYTLWIEGTGSVAVAANTAVGSGFGSASAGAPVVFAISTGGTVDLTVTGSPTLVQVINKGFVLPPVYSAMTVTGNQQVISGLGTQLAGGVAGFVKVDLRAIENFKIFLQLYTSLTDRVFIDFGSAGGPRWSGFLGGVSQGSGAISDAAFRQTGTATIAFAVTDNVRLLRVVGDVQRSDPGKAMPPISNLAIGGDGTSGNNNSYQFTKQLVLIYGTPSRPINQALFDAVYAKAEQAHAAAA